MYNPEPCEKAKLLIREAEVLMRYLLDQAPPAGLTERYAAACARLFPDPPSGFEATQLATVLKWPWTLPLLDAAAGVWRPGSLLRRKLLVALAILETTPELTARFVARDPGPPRVLWLLAVTGISAGLKASAGTALRVAVAAAARRT